jgi:DNA-binding beta-propeller fold protein YncE
MSIALRRAAVALAFATPIAAQQPALVVLNKSEATASMISLADGKIFATMPVGDGPHEVAVSPDARWGVVANYGGAQGPGHSLTVLDLRARKATTTIELGEYLRPHGIAWLLDGKHVAVTSEQARAVIIVDVAAGKVDRVIKTNQPGHLFTLSKDQKRMWTANIATGSISLVDVDKGEVIKTATLGGGPEATDLAPDGREFWAAGSTSNLITILSAATLDTLGSIPTGKRPNRLHFTPDGRWVLVSNIYSGTLEFFDTRTRQLVDRITFPFDSAKVSTSAVGRTGPSAAPEGILIAPDGKRAWVALAAMDQIAEVDLVTRKVTRYIQTGREPDGMGYVP